MFSGFMASYIAQYSEQEWVLINTFWDVFWVSCSCDLVYPELEVSVLQNTWLPDLMCYYFIFKSKAKERNQQQQQKQKVVLTW